MHNLVILVDPPPLLFKNLNFGIDLDSSIASKDEGLAFDGLMSSSRTTFYGTMLVYFSREGEFTEPCIMDEGYISFWWLDLEIKLVADVGIVGAPNAGKSTLLSVISAAQPTIANYPFTTLLPNLGVVSFDYDSTMVVADLPGLLEGAHRGFGSGHEFLRHTERCSVLVHVDGSGLQPEFEYDAVRLELELFSPEIAEKPYIVAFNKMDLPDAKEQWPSFKENLQARGIQVFCTSAVKGEGTHEVISTTYQLLRRSKVTKEEFRGRSSYLSAVLKWNT